MSKYENERFANMKISIFLIIGFTNFVFSCSQNVTDSYSECPYHYFGRRKRAITEYTRWRANLEPTPEFIVKVLDDELPIHSSKKVVAVNIQPVTKSVEKIIVGGAMVTRPIMKSTKSVMVSETVKDYTRFVPPTTVATRVEGDLFIAPVVPQPAPIYKEKSAPIPRARNPQRDESPPASPQFLPRPVVAMARQYAPITPVGFTRRSQIPPLTPPTEASLIRKSILRTTPFEDILIPTRTKSDLEEFGNLHEFHEDNNHHEVTRTTHILFNEPARTIFNIHHTPTTMDDDDDMVQTTEKADDYIDKKTEGKDSDTDDGLFYNYKDDPKLKKSGHDIVNIYDDKNDHLSKEEVETYVTNDMTQKTQFKETDAKQNVPIAVAKSITEGSKFRRVEMTNDDYNEIMPDEEIGNPDSKIIFESTTLNTQSVDKVSQKNIKDRLHSRRRQECSMVKLRDLNFNSPRTLPEIEAKLKHWAEDSPVAKWVDITDGNLTAMERPIYMMIVDDPSSGQVISAKQTVVIVAGIQGRDQHAVASAMYVLYQLIERTESHTDLLSKFRFWIIPVLNPDGYDYAMTFPHRREWTKNLRQNWDVCKGRVACHSCEAYGLRCTVQACYGVNLDRNFEYQWIPAEELRMEHPCGSLYAGERQLSEPETSAFVKYLHSQHRPIYLFIAFKEGDVLGVMYPYSHTRKKRALEHAYKQRASRAAAAASSISGRPYVAGQTSEFLPLYAGGIEDWVDSHLGVDNTYTIMMFRPADTYNTQIATERVVHEAYAAMDTLVLQSVEKLADVKEAQMPPVTLVHAKESRSQSNQISLFLLLITSLRTCFT